MANKKAKTVVTEPISVGSASVEKLVVKTTVKQRNHVARAAMSRSGAGAHEKGATSKRKALEKQLRNELDE
jgi:hypothetical protein